MTTIENNNAAGRVSIIMPAYNAARFIRESLDSVLAQTYKEWELLVVDDCSSDSTREIVREYVTRDPRVILFELPVNSGPAQARNFALEKATGRYIAFLDSDDLWVPNKIERQLKFMREGRLAFAFTSYRRVSERGCLIGGVVPVEAKFSYKKLLKNTGIACLTVMLDRNLCGEVRMPDVRHEDYALWLMLLRRGISAYGLKEDLARYRVVTNSVSNRKWRSASWVWNIYRKQEKLNFVFALWCFVNYAVRGQLKRMYRD